ncbi:MAG: type II toxin-antitoxin system HicB family antitoxin [Rivularia sp. (in: cyanobacteria)]
MITKFIKNENQDLSKVNYSILIEETEGGYTATVWGLPECQSEASTKEEAIKNLYEIVNTRLQNVEIVMAEIEAPHQRNPWIEFAGMYEDNPLFDEVISNIAAYRREIDNQIDLEEQV